MCFEDALADEQHILGFEFTPLPRNAVAAAVGNAQACIDHAMPGQLRLPRQIGQARTDVTGVSG